jgi:pimeloyl-ACP methyl ester carboxylesterase
VRSIIVDGVLPADKSLFLSAPASAEKAFAALERDCQKSATCTAAYPDFRAQVESLVSQAKAGEIKYKGADPLSGAYVEFDIEYEMAVEAIRSSLYNPDAAAMMPYIISQTHEGNYTPLLASLLNSAAVADSMYMGATMSLLCGEDVAVISKDQAVAAGAGSFAGDHYYRTWASYCEGWDYIIPDTSDFFDLVESDVPALALSGSLDPVTPPALAEHWLQGFSNGRHIVVPGTGHNTSYVACMPELMAEFISTLDAKSLDASCFEGRVRLPLMVGMNGNVQ